MPPLTAEDTLDILGPTLGGRRSGLPRAHGAEPGGRPSGVRAGRLPTSSRRCASTAVPGSSDAISALAALLAPEGPARESVALLLRAAAPPRARLRRAQGNSGDPRRRRRPHAHRDLAAAAAHAGFDQGLSVVARRRGPDCVAAKAVQLHRPPLLRVWVRLHCRASAPTKTSSRAKCIATALTRIPPAGDPTPTPTPQAEPAFAMAGGASSGIIEID